MESRDLFDSEIAEFSRKLAVENVSKITLNNYIFSLERVFAFTETPLSKLTLRQIEDYTLHMKDSSKMGTLVLDLYTLRKYFKHRNSKLCNQIVVPKVIDTSGLVKPTARKEDLDALLSKPLMKNDFKDKRLKIALLVLFNIGCRRRSLVNVKVVDIDFKTKEITIRVMKKRNPITGELAEYTLGKIKEYLTNRGVESKWLLCDEGGRPISERTLTDELREVERKFPELEKIRPHAFRRGVFTDMVNNNENPVDIAKAMGVGVAQVLRYASALNMTRIKKFQSERL